MFRSGGFENSVTPILPRYELDFHDFAEHFHQNQPLWNAKHSLEIQCASPPGRKVLGVGMPHDSGVARLVAKWATAIQSQNWMRGKRGTDAPRTFTAAWPHVLSFGRLPQWLLDHPPTSPAVTPAAWRLTAVNW